MRGNACLRESRKWSEEDRENHQIMIKSDPKWGREGQKVLQSKESPAKPSGSHQTKVDCQRSPRSPRSWSVLVPVMHHHWLGAAHGRYGLGTNIAMDFKMQELEPLVGNVPCSWRSRRHIPVATTPIFALLNHCQKLTSSGILSIREK